MCHSDPILLRIARHVSGDCQTSAPQKAWQKHHRNDRGAIDGISIQFGLAFLPQAFRYWPLLQLIKTRKRAQMWLFNCNTQYRIYGTPPITRCSAKRSLESSITTTSNLLVDMHIKKHSYTERIVTWQWTLLCWHFKICFNKKRNFILI